MPWSNQGGGGPWGGGGGQSPWGGGGRRGPQQPNIEEMLKRSQDRFKRFFPGGFGGGKVIIVVVIALVALWMLTGLYRVEPSEVGVELVFGKVRATTPEGLHFNWPEPIGEVETPNVQGQRLTVVGADEAPARGSGPASSMVEDDGLMLTGDRNIINIRAAVLWRVSPDGLENLGEETPPRGVMNFLFNIRNPGVSVKDATEAALREIVGKSRFEFVRTEGRGPIEQEAGALIQGILDSYGAGVRIISIELQRTDPPPGDVFDAFRDVETAEQDKQTTINRAQAYRNQVVQEAQGQADQIIAQAEGYREARIREAEGEASRFLAVFGEYRQNAEVTRRRIYLETMSDVLSRMDKTLIDELGQSGVVPYLPLNELRRTRDGTRPGSEQDPATGGSGSAPAPSQGGN